MRDSRHRQHDPIIGVVPLKLSDILQKSSEVTRWYPLDGGIGFGRVRISLLFRSVELKLPPPQLGWDIGTFEFTSDEIQTSNYQPAPKVKLRFRTGGSTGSVKRHCSSREGDGIKFDISGNHHSHKLRLPVRHRYRSPVFLEFYPVGKRHADAFASIWLQELTDGEEQEFDVPIWRCANSLRLSQNYITEKNFREVPDMDIEEIGRVKFKGRFSAGTDSDHVHFVSDNDSRETIETWEACYAEGVRQSEVEAEVPPTTQELHDQALTQGRDVRAQADEKERQKWLAKDGTDWSGAFGKDPSELAAKKKGVSKDSEEYDNFEDANQYENSDDDDDSPDLGIQDASAEPSAGSAPTTPENRRMSTETRGSAATGATGATSATRKSTSSSPVQAFKDYRERSRDLHRKHRGLMQWRPMRNAQFAKDEAKFAVRKATNVTALDGRKPDIETEV